METAARPWRLDRLADYRQALSWLSRRAQLIDTNQRTPAEVAALISDTMKRSDTTSMSSTTDATDTSATS